MSYRQETKHIQEELLACETGPITLQMTICSACGEKLSLPTVHFICKHSYHARCLNENSKHCLQCYKEHRKLVSIQNALKSQAQEDFFEKLHHSEDGFSVVADWFSKKEIQ
ncbi:Vacuolar protein sorting-associated protein 11 [Coelomomyces lativittatus]|nr:Vacuolar protein sorting-associated protein 11 [Coelomomyces lativittatus]KAJ1517874.1 Vacuolar protein sorting-associated protein 11 [Coelomomyces lativittatus]